jgi:hypothetical protein
MSLMGQSRHFWHVCAMSGLHSEAAETQTFPDFAFVPISDSCGAAKELCCALQQSWPLDFRVGSSPEVNSLRGRVRFSPSELTWWLSALGC